MGNEGEVHSYSLRNIIDFKTQRAETNSMQKSLHNKGLNLYTMPNDRKNGNSILVINKLCLKGV